MFDFFDVIVGWLDMVATMIANMVDMVLLGTSMIAVLSTVPVYLAALMPSLIGLSMLAVLVIFSLKFFLGR